VVCRCPYIFGFIEGNIDLLSLHRAKGSTPLFEFGRRVIDYSIRGVTIIEAVPQP
jgi:hypothetical protein